MSLPASSLPFTALDPVAKIVDIELVAYLETETGQNARELAGACGVELFFVQRDEIRFTRKHAP